MKVAAGRSGYAATTNTINSPTSVVNRRSALARHGGFLTASALVVIVCVTVTLHECATMSGGMAMPGGWLMSMAWMRMPDQSWVAAACNFIGMWLVMMTAMMGPVLVVTLLHFRLRGLIPRVLPGLTAEATGSECCPESQSPTRLVIRSSYRR